MLLYCSNTITVQISNTRELKVMPSTDFSIVARFNNTTTGDVISDCTLHRVLKQVTKAQIAGSMNIVRKNTNYTVVEATDNVILVDAAIGSVNITLPAVTVENKGRIFTIKRVDSSANLGNILFSGDTEMEMILKFL